MNDKNLGELSVLVEERIDHKKWQKWNSNNGFVKGMEAAPSFNKDSLAEMMTSNLNEELDFIEEGSEEEESDEEFENELQEQRNNDTVVFSPFEVAQAFSHFSYWATGRKRLICDIQGVYDEDENVLKLSDPVIHYDSAVQVCVHGRTDRGRKGMAMFHETHKDHCNQLCRFMTGGFKKKYQEKKQHSCRYNSKNQWEN